MTSKMHAITTTIPHPTTDGAVDATVKEPDNMGKMHNLASTIVTSTIVSSTKTAANTEKQTSASTTDGAVDTTIKEPDNMEKRHISTSTIVTSATISSNKATASTEKKQTTTSTTVSAATVYAQLAYTTIQSISTITLLDITTVPSIKEPNTKGPNNNVEKIQNLVSTTPLLDTITVPSTLVTASIDETEMRVNILTYIGEVPFKPEQLAAIEELKKKYRE
ncbi:hypothetical protein M0R45_036043 [Rubus argutus]|uniref:Uncharacterized protein n=1 Tax=Rubus argutus TaxID=59490 RepID=A0AAW1VYQ2_RUBAR